jgi:hypothetical protein
MTEREKFMAADSQTTVPRGKLRVVETRLSDDQRHAAYVTIVLEDEDGTRWAFDASSFRFDLEREDAHAGW